MAWTPENLDHPPVMLTRSTSRAKVPQALPGIGTLHVISGGFGYSGPEWSTAEAPPYRSLAHSLIVVHRGQAEVEIDGAWTDLRVGHLAIVPGYHLLRRRTTGFEHSWIVFSCASLADDLYLGQMPRILLEPPADWWTGNLDLLARWRTLDDPTLAEATRLEGLLLIAVARMAEAVGAPPATPDHGSGLVHRAVAWLEDHYQQRPTVLELAKAIGCSPNHLHTCFVTAVGLTPAAYAEHRRMRDAQRLLLAGDLTIQDIARRCGYDDPFHFSRVFRRHFGGSPRRLRHRDHHQPLTSDCLGGPLA